MNEFNVLEQALNLATQKGAFDLKTASQVNHCLEVTRKNITEYEKIKNSDVDVKPKEVGPTLTKDEPIKKPIHK